MSKVIYALFDDGEQSVKKSMEPLGYEVYSFGIQDKDTVIKCDLTNLEEFFKVSKKLPLPDYIMANPPCETFSICTSCSYAEGKKGTIYYYNDGQKVNDFEQWKTSSYSNIKRLKSDKEEYFVKLKKNVISGKSYTTIQTK